MLKPFLKWTGGKTRSLPVLLPYILSIYDSKRHVYVEPFLGGGAVVFALQPSRALLNDVNSNLMSCYWCLKYHLDNLLDRLRVLESRYAKATMDERQQLFSQQRDLYNQLKFTGMVDLHAQSKETLLDVATCFIFLNKTSFNGLYRENKSGTYNVPFGKYATIHLYQNLEAVATYLQQPGIHLYSSSFQPFLESHSSPDQFYYFDPPYLECDESKFNAYNAVQFSLSDHAFLLQFMTTHPSVCSNSKAPELLARLPDSLRYRSLSIARCISSTQGTRRKQDEVILYNASLDERLEQRRTSILTYCRGQSSFASSTEERAFLQDPLLAVLCQKQLGSVNTGVLAEFMIYDCCVRRNIPIEKPATLTCRVKPDWKIVLGSTSYYIEVKSRSYTCTGTASEKLDSIPRKYSKVFSETGCRTLVVFVAQQVSEKNALELLHPTTEYCYRFLATSKEFGIDDWLTFDEFLNKIEM